MVNLNINNEDLGFDEGVSAALDANNGFVYTIPDVSFKNQEWLKVISELKNIFGDIKEYDFSRTKNSIFKKYISKDMIAYVSGNSSQLFGTFLTKNNDDLLKTWEVYNANVDANHGVPIYMNSFSLQGQDVSQTMKNIDVEELNYISDSYYPYIQTDVMFEQFFTGSENILLLSGAPGTGKSKILSLAIKYAAQNPNFLPYDKMTDESSSDFQFVAIANVKGIDVLSNDQFWVMIENLKPDFVFIDDLDYMLTKRDSEVITHEDHVKNSFLDHFLTFTDGIEKNKTKFIITTNQPCDDIDTALLRKGRLFDILEFRELNQDEALCIWEENGLDSSDFYEVFDSDEILPADLGSEINKRLNIRIDNSTESYLKEDGISRLKSAKRVKKIAL